MQDYNKLDVAAKLFPAVSSKHNSSVFRVAVILKEEIDEHTLQLALNIIYQRYELFFSRLRRGVFWDYFDKNHLHFTVEKENDIPCNNIVSFQNKGFMLKVLYYKNRMSVEAFHAVSDGSGILEFLKSLVYYYLSIKHGKIIDHQNKVLLFDEKNTNNYDSFNDYFGDLKKVENVKKQKIKKTLQIRGQRYRNSGHSVVTGIVSVDDIKKHCKKNECTITEFLIACMIWAIYEEKQKGTKSERAIVITVPVNLRKPFRSNTLRNFFAVVRVSYTMDKDTTFNTLLRDVSFQLKANTELDYLKKESLKNVKISNNIFSKHTPRLLKNMIIPIGFNWMGEIKKTITISNVGQFDFPDGAKPYIEHAEVLSYPTKSTPINSTVCSFGDKLSVNFIRSIKDASVIRGFFKTLSVYANTDVAVYSNMWGDEYE